MSNQAIIKTDIKELKRVYTGKVRDIYAANDSGSEWLIVASDRISAFDVVFKEGIPDKGRVLTQVSNRWFNRIDNIGNHLISTNPEKELSFLKNYPGLNERAVIVKKVNRLPVECVVRGYLLGSVWKEYQNKGTVCGITLPEGIPFAGNVPDPVFTPATKAETGHDENINHSHFYDIVGKELGDQIIEASVSIYKMAAKLMKEKGIILADTKFEFGIDENGKLILVDEVLTPDSSRYWDGALYKPGESPQSFDKQFVRDYLLTLDWDKKPPAPPLPDDIIGKTREKYLSILDIISQIV